MTQVIQIAAANREQFSGTVEKLPNSFVDRPAMPAIRTDSVYLLYTSFNETRTALPVACRLAESLQAPLTIVHVRTVPYPNAVDRPTGASPAESAEFTGHLQAEGVAARTRVFLCRRERGSLRLAFKPHSLIVMGGRHHWWPTGTERLRKALEAAGHFVVLVDPSLTQPKRPDTAGKPMLAKEPVHA